MRDTVIRAERLSKKYVIGHESVHRGHSTLRDAIVRGAKGLARSFADTLHGRAIVQGDNLEDFWALKELDFSVARGEVVGIIGRNGAGKSTLLKILSRIVEPTSGRVEIQGRVSSLLEVGTGFHPELSGRENIFLNGAILGMRRSEIREKFDDIVAFAGIDRFLDTPVKRYSSGMYVRLAFAVAAHLDPEILIIDEVLAVGDAEFQKRCLGKMEAVAREGRTVLFVSHNLHAIERLCSRAVLLQSGTLAFDGAAAAACERYQAGAASWELARRLSYGNRQGDGRVRITQLDVLDAEGRSVKILPAGAPLRVSIRYVVDKPLSGALFGFALVTTRGARIFNTTSGDTGGSLTTLDREGVVEVEIPDLTLAIGSYNCNVSISDRHNAYCDYLTDVPLVEITDSECLPRSRVYDQAAGAVFSKARWGVTWATA